jgi:hypothetical protein
MLLLALAASLTIPPVKTYGDWSVACDNVRVCEMTSLVPENVDISGNNGSFSARREPTPGSGFTVRADARRDLSGSYRIAIDGTPVEKGMARGARVIFNGQAAERIVAAMLNGKQATLIDSRGVVVVRASLSGSAAALRYIDAEQGRAGTVTAVAAKGVKPAAGVTVAPAVPSVKQIPPSGTPAKLSAALRTRLGRESQCDAEYQHDDERPETERVALGGGQTLVMIPCGDGAYNRTSVPYIVNGAGAELAKFDYAPGYSGGDAPALLVNAEWDKAKGELTSYAKGRGLGDCGRSETYVWDGSRFRLIEARAMGECRGSVNWLRVWHAEAVKR